MAKRAEHSCDLCKLAWPDKIKVGLALTGESFLFSVWGSGPGWGVLWVILWDSSSAEALKKEECREEGEEVGE